MLRAADQSLSPQAATAGRLGVAEAILPIFKGHLTTIANGAGGKVEILQAFSECTIVWVVPDTQQILLK